VVGRAAAPKAAAPVVVTGGPTWLTAIFASAQQSTVVALSFSETDRAPACPPNLFFLVVPSVSVAEKEGGGSEELGGGVRWPSRWWR
jgi:hypothetical protein